MQSPTGQALPMLDFTDNELPENWRIPRKGPDSLEQFNGELGKYNLWRARVANHIPSKQPKWHKLLRQALNNPSQITPEHLVKMRLSCQDVNGGELSRDLYTFIGVYLVAELFKNQSILAVMEGNGLELRRILHRDHEGRNAITKTNDLTRFHEFPPGDDKHKLQQTSNEWLDLVKRVGGAVPDENLRVMLLKIIPPDYRSHIYENTSLDTDKILAWITTQLNYLHSDVIVKAAHRRDNSINALTNDKLMKQFVGMGFERNLASRLVHTVGRNNPRSPPRPSSDHGGARRPAQAPPAAPPGYQRPPRPLAPGSSFKDQRFNDCWHCGEEGHPRTKCPEFLDILKANGGQAPIGVHGEV